MCTWQHAGHFHVHTRAESAETMNWRVVVEGLSRALSSVSFFSGVPYPLVL